MRLRRPSRDRRSEGDRGSALALVPAGFLVLMFLGAIAVDNGATYLAQRQLEASLQAAANDAAGAAVSSGAFYAKGAIQIDPTRAASVVCLDLAAQDQPQLHDTTVAIAVNGAAIFVRAHAQVTSVFGRLIPGFAERPVSAEAAAAGDEGPNAAPVPPPTDFTPLPC